MLALAVTASACGSDAVTTLPADDATTDGVTTETVGNDDGAATEDESTAEALFPDVVGVEAVHDGDGSWTFDVTLSSPYDSPDRYADAWRVVGPDGTMYGERILLHDHAAEQPFTRSQSGIEIPADVTSVTVEGRDQISGWGGATMEVTLER